MKMHLEGRESKTLLEIMDGRVRDEGVPCKI